MIIVLITLWKINSNVENTISKLLEICIFSFLINGVPVLGEVEGKHIRFIVREVLILSGRTAFLIMSEALEKGLTAWL